MMLRLAALALTLPLLACSEAQMCRQSALAPLSSLDRQIREAEENIARGYEVIELGPVAITRRVCTPVALPPAPPPGPPPDLKPRPHRPGTGALPPHHDKGAAGPGHRFQPHADNRERVSSRGGAMDCRVVRDFEPREVQRPVNVEAEMAKLASLRAQRVRLLPQVEARLAQCPTD